MAKIVNWLALWDFVNRFSVHFMLSWLFIVDGPAFCVWLLDAWILGRVVYNNHTHRLANLLHHYCAAYEMQQLKNFSSHVGTFSSLIATNSKIWINKQLWQVCFKRNIQFVAPLTKLNDHIQCTASCIVFFIRQGLAVPYNIPNIFLSCHFSKVIHFNLERNTIHSYTHRACQYFA